MSAERPPVSAVSAEIQATTVLDAGVLDAASGLLPLVRNALSRLRADDVLEIRSTLGTLTPDLASWCRLNACELLAAIDAGDHSRYLIRKGGAAAHWDVPDWDLHLPLRGSGIPLNGVATPSGAPDLRDAFVGRRTAVPEVAPQYLGFVPRGAVAEPGLPEYPYTLNAKVDVWVEDIAELYEQTVAQQWSVSRDIPWSQLPALPDEMERAVCQLMTFLAENEYSALYVPAKFLPRVNAQYVEIVLFLAAMINDEARHIEVFTKRALANGGGLQYATALTEHSLRGLLVEDDYFRSSFLLHVLGEGTFLDLLGFIEDHSPDPVTREIVRRARLDEGRHVAYGLGHVRRRLQADPGLAGVLETAASERAASLREVAGGNPFVTEALATLAGGGSRGDQIAAGLAAVRELRTRMHASRVRRMRQVGLDHELAVRISELHTPNYM